MVKIGRSDIAPADLIFIDLKQRHKDNPYISTQQQTNG